MRLTHNSTEGVTIKTTSPLLVNGTVSFPITASGTVDDIWTIIGFTKSGASFTLAKSKCNLSDDDVKSGNPARVNLLPRGVTFEHPKSASCSDVPYDK
jgi:hypothetical protein